jgi:hypothetical protein
VNLPAHLIIKTEGRPFDSLLEEWRWLVPSGFKPVVMTSFGDVFLTDNNGRVHFLDLMAGELKQVAATRSEFETMCEDRGQRRNWFLGFLVMELRKTHGELGPGECYSCKVPLTLGGALDPENFERMPLETHYSVLGQLHRQTKHLPPGTTIQGSRIEKCP